MAIDFFNWITIDDSIYAMQLAIFALAALSVVLMLLFIFPKLFNSFYLKHKHGIGYNLLFSGLLISLAIVKYGVYSLQYNLPFFSKQLLIFLGVEILILTLSTLIVMYATKGDEKHQTPQQEIELPKEKIAYLAIKGDLLNENLSLPLKELLYIKSSDNYSEFYFISPEGIQNKLLRLTLKSVEEQISNNSIIRCHKSYIVNTTHVKSISGNANNAKLHFKSHDITLPVSRSKRDDVITLLEALG